MIQPQGSRFVRLGLMALVSFLTAFHLLLLGSRVLDGSVLDPAVAVEWVIGLALLFGLLRLQKAEPSLVKGHSALVLWLLVLLLHAIAVVPGEAGSYEVGLDKNLLAIGPISAALGGGLVRLVERLLSRAFVAFTPVFLSAPKTTREVRLSSADLLRSLAPRGPPV